MMLAFDRNAFRYDQEAIVQRRMALQLASLLPEGKTFRQVFEFGCGTGFLTEALLQRIHSSNLLLNDLSERMLERAVERISPHVAKTQVSVKPYPGDIERMPIPQSSLIASSASLQWLSNPLALLTRCWLALEAGGYLLIATFGEENLRELRHLTGKGLNYLSPKVFEVVAKELWQAEKVVVEEAYECLYFSSARKVLNHLSSTGVTRLPNEQHASLSRKDLETLCKNYEINFANEQGVPITYHPIYLLAKKN